MSRSLILDEIRRVRSEIGKTPGRREILRYAGIKESDWYGKFWAKWSDATREAGCLPNEMNPAFDDDYIMQNLVALIRELGGKFPTKGEMRLKKRTDATFPSDKVFFTRYGPRDAIAARLSEWCQKQDGYQDIIPACEPSTRSTKKQSIGSTEEDVTDFGFVYLCKAGRYYKIGRTNAVGRREAELAIQLPEKARTVHAIRTDDPAGIETYWHRRFASKRKNGEWFDLDSADVRAFLRRKFM